jgi:aminotransferase
MIKTSNISANIKTSLTRQLFNLAKQYDDVVDFTLGDPDVQTHQSIKDAACRAIQDGRTRYSQNAGLLALRETIHDYYMRKENLDYMADGETIVTVGAMEGLYLALLALLDPGDEVLIPAPYYVNYVQMCQMCNAVPVVIDNPDADGLTFNVEDIEAAITPRTRLIMINTPSNPSGKIIPHEKLEAIADMAKRHDLVVISDEVYKSLIYDRDDYRSIAAIDGMRERTILINSLSKEFCMTGWRIGYVLGPSEVITAMTKLQENVAACAPLPSQYAAIEALSGTGDYSGAMVEVFRRRRDLLTAGIQAIKGLECTAPEATFYLMVDISATGMTSEEFAFELLKKEHVALVPGITYGKCCDRYVRIAFTVDEDIIREGVARIRRFVESL